MEWLPQEAPNHGLVKDFNKIERLSQDQWRQPLKQQDPPKSYGLTRTGEGKKEDSSQL